MSPGPQQRLLDQVLGPLPVPVDQPQGMGVQRLRVLVVQRAQQLGVVVADGGLLASGARPAVASAREYVRSRQSVQPEVRPAAWWLPPTEVFMPGSHGGRRALTTPS